jgi:plastocyanin
MNTLATKFIATFVLLTPALASFNAFSASLSVQVLDKDGKPAADAVVVVTPAAKGTPREPLAQTATIVQEKMQFVPAVSLVPLGAKLRFVNNDPWDHHVRGGTGGGASATAGAAPQGFELRLEGKTEGKSAKAVEISLDKPGAHSAVLLGCFLHSSMRGHVYVSDSPWAAKTDAQGMAQWTDLPEGPAQLRVWHADQLVDLPTQTLSLGGTATKASVQLQVVPRRKRL